MSWLPTPEQQERIDAHWADVRAGLCKTKKVLGLLQSLFCRTFTIDDKRKQKKY